MAKWFDRPGQIVAGVAMAAIVAATTMLHLRRRRRRALTVPHAQTVNKADHPSRAEAQPLLTPWTFAISHFGLLVLLLAMMTAGLAFRGIERYPTPNTFHVNGGDAARGRAAIMKHGCGGCHVIPGVRGARGQVGPSLAGFADRMYIAGRLPNTPERLMEWLQNPRRHAPGTAMPDLDVTEAESRDMAAYFYSE